VVHGECRGPAEEREHPAPAGGEELLDDLVHGRDDQVQEHPDRDQVAVQQRDERQVQAHLRITGNYRTLARR